MSTNSEPAAKTPMVSQVTVAIYWCSRKRCAWFGSSSQLHQIPSRFGAGATDSACPVCRSTSFYLRKLPVPAADLSATLVPVAR